jgi:hypothetical protein
MAGHVLGIVTNGVTGRMEYRQHLVRSVLAVEERGGVELADGSREGQRLRRRIRRDRRSGDRPPGPGRRRIELTELVA